MKVLSRFLLVLVTLFIAIPVNSIDRIEKGYNPASLSSFMDAHPLFKLLVMKKFIASMQSKKDRNPVKSPIARSYDWVVVGGGIAGILSIGTLIENGVSPSSIAWVDKEFNVGALGKNYQNVPGNLSTRQWISALENCSYLKKCPHNPIEYLKKYDLDSFYPLSIIVKPMQHISNWLLTHVNGFKSKVIKIDSNNNAWHLTLSDTTQLQAHKVILATGSHPRSLDYGRIQEIPLPVALNQVKLAEHVGIHDTVAVVGSSHSAVIALMFLSQLPVKNIVHFYTRPFLYTQQTEEGIVNAESGLKGSAAEFAKEVIEKNRIANLVHVFDDKQARDSWLQQCTKIIYATGFTPNVIPWPNGNYLQYDDTTGIIAQNLFGFGIAFPGKKADAAGKMEHLVGMPHFLEYGKHVIPQWIALS